MQNNLKELAVIAMKSVPGPLNGYHEMRHNFTVTCQNQLEFWNPKGKTDFLIAVKKFWSLGQCFFWKVDPRGFLTICYCFRTIGCCCPYCFLKIFGGGQDLDGGGKVVMGDP